MFFAKKRNQPSRPRSFQPRLEALEDRSVPTVTYHGGALLPHVETQAVFYGSDFYGSGDLLSVQHFGTQLERFQLESFLDYFTSSPYLDRLAGAGYNVGRGSNTESTGQVYDRDYLGNVVLDSGIRRTLQELIDSGDAAAPDANRLYVVYVEPNVEVINDNYTDPNHPNRYDDSVNDFAGYHQSFIGESQGNPVWIRYAVVTTPGGTINNGYSAGLTGLSTLDEMTLATSHEVAEAATNPDGAGGWYDDGLNQEIGDIANGQTVRLNGYLVQQMVDKADRLIFPADLHVTATPFSVFAGGTFSGQVATAVDNLGTTQASTLNVTINWGDGTVSSGAAAFDASGKISITGTHRYAKTGHYGVIVIVQDSANANQGDLAFGSADVHYNYFSYLGSSMVRLGSFLNH